MGITVPRAPGVRPSLGTEQATPLQPLGCSGPFPSQDMVPSPRTGSQWVHLGLSSSLGGALEPRRPQPRQARWAQSWARGSEDEQASAGSRGQNHSAPMSPGLSPAVHICLPIGGPGGEPSGALRAHVCMCECVCYVCALA